MSDLIIIDITENEKVVIDGSLNPKEIKGSGNLSVKNPSSKSRLWNLMCDLKEIVNTTINSRELNVGILNPSQEFNKDYEIQNLKQPSLIVNEIPSTALTTFAPFPKYFFNSSTSIIFFIFCFLQFYF